MRSNILVTDGAGYIGSHTCKALAASGYDPIVLDDLSVGHRWAVKWGPLIVGDIGDRALVRKTVKRFKIRATVHFAAHAYVGESVEQPRKYFENNVSKTLVLLDALLDAGVHKIVFSSSCATYGVPRGLPIAEDHPQSPISPYGASKLFVENVLNWYERAYGLRYMNLRYFNDAGADPDGEIGEDHTPETHLIPLVIATAQRHNPFSSSLKPITTRPTAPPCAIMCTSAISRALTSKRSIIFSLKERAPASIWGPVVVTRSAM
jgi:UDP-arabinose 4-epimerase